jgi:hypothetical protein
MISLRFARHRMRAALSAAFRASSREYERQTGLFQILGTGSTAQDEVVILRGYPAATATQLTESTRYLDRRGSQRVTANLRAILSARGPLSWARHKAFIVDYSISGLRVRAKASFTSGQVVRIVSETNPGQPAVCRVVWVGTAGSPQESEAGLVFLDLVG